MTLELFFLGIFWLIQAGVHEFVSSTYAEIGPIEAMRKILRVNVLAAVLGYFSSFFHRVNANDGRSANMKDLVVNTIHVERAYFNYIDRDGETMSTDGNTGNDINNGYTWTLLRKMAK